MPPIRSRIVLVKRLLFLSRSLRFFFLLSPSRYYCIDKIKVRDIRIGRELIRKSVRKVKRRGKKKRQRKKGNNRVGRWTSRRVFVFFFSLNPREELYERKVKSRYSRFAREIHFLTRLTRESTDLEKKGENIRWSHNKKCLLQ